MHENANYKVHKKIANIICDMGFIIADSPKEKHNDKYHRLIKQTDKHMIVVTYEIRKRLIETPKDALDETEGQPKQMLGESFGSFLKRHGMVPPNMMGQEYDERQMQKEHEEALKNPLEKILDDPDDQSMFEVAIVNKKDKALVTDCQVKNGEIYFDKIFTVKHDAHEFVKGIWIDKTLNRDSNKFYDMTHGPRFSYLSEPLQNNLMEYFFSVGLRPEIGLCVEFLSWNKEQRMYLAWLRDLYMHLFSHPDGQKQQIDNE